MQASVRVRRRVEPALAFVACLVICGAAAIGCVNASLPAEDQARLAEYVFTSPGPAAIDADRAMAAVRSQYDLGAPGVRADAYLKTVAARVPGEAPLLGGGRTMWIVRITGMETYPEVPAGSEETAGNPPILSHAYAFVDATSGELLFTSWKQ